MERSEIRGCAVPHESVDPSEGFVSHARAHISNRRAEFRVDEARLLPVGEKEFDAVVSGLVLNFVPDQPRALAEIRRAVRPDGKVAIYVWDYAGRYADDALFLGYGDPTHRARSGSGRQTGKWS